jgi:ketosteroid isomerase-like protein
MNADVVTAFYTALAARDGEAMAAAYAPEIVFEDPAFGVLTGRDPGDMWRMLCSSSSTLSVTHTILDASRTAATVRWVADYTFGATGRPVHNEVTAHLTLQDGRIAAHRDVFDFWRWSGQALGAPGRLLGWTPMLRAKVRGTARANLAAFQARQG